MKQEKNTNRAKSEKFNWKLVIISFIILIIVYMAISVYIERKKEVPRETLYCHFDKFINDTLPRDECGIIKIVSSDMDLVKIEKLKNWSKLTGCSDSIVDLEKCDGETYHFTQFRLSTFCESKPCNTDGVVCGAYFITYYDGFKYRQSYEEGMFTEPNLESWGEVMGKLMECDA